MAFYSNAALGRGFENIAAMFAPPSGQDAAAWAAANAKNAEAKRAAALYDYAQSADYDQVKADRMGVLAGLYSPNQSYYAVDQNNATTQRGQNLDSADRRYGVDVGARTSLANNQADNERALQDRAIQERGALARLYASPIKLGQGETAILPNQTAAATGLNGRLEGHDKPLSETEWRAAQNERLRQSGQLTDRDLLDVIMGEKTPVEAIGPDGRTPTFMSPGAAVRTGAQPAPSKPLVNVQNGGEGAFEKTLGEKQAGLFIDLAADGVAARNDRALLDRFDDQAKDLPGGMLGGLQSLASQYGIKLGDNASNVEAANAIIARLVPAARQGMPGAASDRDVALFKSSLPSLSQTPQGRQIISDTLRGLAATRVDQARIATAVVNGDMSRADGMRAIQALPDPFAAVRNVSGADTSPRGGSAPAAATATPATSTAQAAPVRVSTPEEARRLPPGTRIILPDGSEGRVP
ncbi:hypothetical protein GCM10011390_44060 [Aureimonas endophytica]|uniref:Uncharacterized protein n=1 Tax=Aureimonas endophytica TaxID=2027858 RepID=A0A917A0H3_9HYPH|nr:hypothetical protein [Aureimonas endophytica]GGE19981.1 hypothetical protein GCM10011390_44060 [Aureimonas endophytica]